MNPNNNGHAHLLPVEVFTLTYDPNSEDYTWDCHNVGGLIGAVQRIEMFQMLMFEYARKQDTATQQPPAKEAQP